MQAYSPPLWAWGPHLQTFLPGFAWWPRVSYERERWTTPDGDFVDVDWVGPQHAPRLLVLFHGLEGSGGSHYARVVAAEALKTGYWRFAVPHFRGCSGEPNRKARAYHSGDSDEIDWMLRRFKQRSDREVYAAGVSLGGNALLKWLGTKHYGAADVVKRAAAISAVFDLERSGAALSTGAGRFYSFWFLNLTCMRWNALRKYELFEQEHRDRGVEKRKMFAARTLPEYDDALTAPLHNFRDKEHYWADSSAYPRLKDISVPTLLLHARNDPILPMPQDFPPGVLSPSVKSSLQQEGGHGGFPDDRRWLARTLLDFFDAR